MNAIDSSAWLEYFADGKNAVHFAKPIQNTKELIVPVITIYEVFKRVLQQRNETAALEAIALMQMGQVVDVNITLALSAALLSQKHKLPMADSLILATAHQHQATLWTQDADFSGIKGVRYFAKS